MKLICGRCSNAITPMLARTNYADSWRRDNLAASGSSLPGRVGDVVIPPDTTPPTVTINKAAAQSDPTSSSPILFDVVFSEPVTGFTAADISFTGSTAGTLAASITGTGPTYTVSVTGMSITGNVVASIPAAVVIDLAGNPNTVATFTDKTVAWVQPVVGTDDGKMDFSLVSQSGLFVLLDDF